MVSLFRANEGTLAMKMVTLASTVLLLQGMKILPTEVYCGLRGDHPRHLQAAWQLRILSMQGLQKYQVDL